jgi:hypothetical protein
MHCGQLLLTSPEPIRCVGDTLIDLINTKLLLALVRIEGCQVRYGLINRSQMRLRRMLGIEQVCISF